MDFDSGLNFDIHGIKEASNPCHGPLLKLIMKYNAPDEEVLDTLTYRYAIHQA